MLGLAVEAARPLPVRGNIKAELRGNHYLFAIASECLAYEFFVDEWPISFRCIEEGHAPVDGCSDHTDSLLFFDSRTVAVAQPHATKTERRHFKIAELAFLHANLFAATGATSRCCSLYRSRAPARLFCLFE